MSNRQYWDESQAAFYEVYYLTANHKKSGRNFWLRGTLLKTEKPDDSRFGALWLAAFGPDGDNLALHRYFPRSECRFRPAELALEIADSHLEEGRWRAAFEQDGHKLAWDLSWQPHPLDLYMLPQLVRRSGLNRADVCTANVDVALFGHIEIDGECFEFTGDSAGQSHHWGRHYARSWIWAHCNDFVQAPGIWFELLAVDLFGLGRRRLPFCMLAYGDGENELATTLPLDLVRCRAAYEGRVWLAEFEKGPLRLEARISAAENAFVAVPYISPQGRNYTCRNSCRCRAELRLLRRKNCGFEILRELYSEDGAHAEFCTAGECDPQSFRFGGLLKPGVK